MRLRSLTKSIADLCKRKIAERSRRQKEVDKRKSMVPN